MQIEVLLFASLAESAGCPSVRLEVPDPVTVAELLQAIARECPSLKNHLTSIRVAIDHEFSNPEDAIPPNAEIALIPPVSGG